jgi:hypothetical protein
MTVDAGMSTEAHGSWAIWNAAVNRLGNNKPDYKGNCYAKVRRLMRPVYFGPSSYLGRRYNGPWIIIHYFFFYSFNFSTNIHEGDWDRIVPIKDEPDDEVPQSPLFFRGHWGEVSPTRSGWDGPKGPLYSKIWSDCDRTGHFESLLLSDDRNSRKRYSRGGKFLATVMMNTHRV